MIRRKFPAKLKKDDKIISRDEILKDLTKSEIARMLEIQTKIQTRLINIKKDTFQIGELLYEAKATLEHGMFTPWIELFFNSDLPYSTAHFYMKVYEVFKDNPETVQYIPSKYLLMITSKEFPAEIVNLLNEHPEKINKEGLQQINEVYDLFKSGTIGGSQFLEIAKNQIKLGIDIWKGETEHRLNSNMRLSLQWGGNDILKRIKALRRTAREMAGIYPYDPESPEHKNLIDNIDETIKELNEFKIDLKNKRGFWRRISTKDGKKFIPNL